MKLIARHQKNRRKEKPRHRGSHRHFLLGPNLKTSMAKLFFLCITKSFGRFLVSTTHNSSVDGRFPVRSMATLLGHVGHSDFRWGPTDELWLCHHPPSHSPPIVVITAQVPAHVPEASLMSMLNVDPSDFNSKPLLSLPHQKQE